MTIMKTSQTQKMMYPTAGSQVRAAAKSPAPARFPAPTPVAANTRSVPGQPALVHPSRDGHWAFYVCVAAFCLVATFVILSIAAKGYWD